MYKVKYYSRDKVVGEEHYSNLEKAEESLYQSYFSTISDYYEIIDRSTDRILQEFDIPPLLEHFSEVKIEEEDSSDWLYRAREDY